MFQRATKQNRKGFFSLPAELRNTIYEYVLADVQDNICIDLTRGPNKDINTSIQPKETDTQQKTCFASGDASPLSILLACRKINKEASAMAYSKMSITLDIVHRDATRLDALWGTEGYRAEFARQA